jgi:hypothetical protein
MHTLINIGLGEPSWKEESNERKMETCVVSPSPNSNIDQHRNGLWPVNIHFSITDGRCSNKRSSETGCPHPLFRLCSLG